MCPLLGLYFSHYDIVGMLLSVTALLLGVFILLKPHQTIETQIICYRNINWDVKPVSMDKEIKKTKSFGVLLSILSILAIISILTRCF